MVELTILRDTSINDTFLHVSLNMWHGPVFGGCRVACLISTSQYNSALHQPDQTPASITHPKQNSFYYVWVECSDFITNESRAISSWLPPGRYLIKAINPLQVETHQLNNVTLQVATLKDYQAMQMRAKDLVDYLFLQQVRVLQIEQEINLVMSPSTSISCQVKHLAPIQGTLDDGWGVVGMNCQLVVLPLSLKDSNIPDVEPIRIRALSTNISRIHPDTSQKLLSTIMVDASLLMGWVYLPRSIMTAHQLVQHQWISPEFLVKIMESPSSSLETSFSSWKTPSPSWNSEPSKASYLLKESGEFQQLQRIHGIIGRLFELSQRNTVEGPNKAWALAMKGDSLVGKTWMVRYLVEHGSFPSYYLDMASAISSGSTIPKIEFIQKAFIEHFDAIHKVAPAVIFIDHIPSYLLLGSEQEVNEHEIEWRHQQLFFWLEAQITFLLKTLHCPVVIITSAPSLGDLYSLELFLDCIKVEKPEADHRALLLATTDPKLIEETVGLVPHQLLVYNSYSAVLIDNLTTKSNISPVIPLWEELAGLEEAKEEIEENLIWPLQYAELYARHNVTQPMGILIVGETGSGKTILVQSLVHRLTTQLHQGQRLVKPNSIFQVGGPSLLNKYVGASEAAIRKLFAKARAHAPSIIIIEELDSIAPCRGHDHTGITDRIVNQLLTELDGTEERTGVNVLATTSRPHLIDPAVLRAGRISSRINLPGRAMTETNRHRLILYLLLRRSDLIEEYHHDAELVNWLGKELWGWTPAEIASVIRDIPLPISDPTMMIHFIETHRRRVGALIQQSQGLNYNIEKHQLRQAFAM